MMCTVRIAARYLIGIHESPMPMGSAETNLGTNYGVINSDGIEFRAHFSGGYLKLNILQLYRRLTG